MDEIQQPGPYVLFVKTNKARHHGPHVFFSIEEFNDAKDLVKNEVDHVVRSAREENPEVVLESWGLISSATGEVVEEFTRQ